MLWQRQAWKPPNPASIFKMTHQIYDKWFSWRLGTKNVNFFSLMDDWKLVSVKGKVLLSLTWVQNVFFYHLTHADLKSKLQLAWKHGCESTRYVITDSAWCVWGELNALASSTGGYICVFHLACSFQFGFYLLHTLLYTHCYHSNHCRNVNDAWRKKINTTDFDYNTTPLFGKFIFVYYVNMMCTYCTCRRTILEQILISGLFQELVYYNWIISL